MIISRLLRKGILLNKYVLISITILIMVVGVYFVYIEKKIIYAANTKPKDNAEYVIILGAGVNGNVPSKTLKNRIDAALEYLKNNEDTIVIASGGKGVGENVSEAQVIKEYLISGGFPKDKIIVEDKSTSTVENIKFSKRFITNNDAEVVLVTSDFHIFRATQIAKKQGLINVTGCSAKPGQMTKLNNYIREFFAIVKDKLMGNI